MASNTTRYAPAPQQDPDAGRWAQAPPSYQAAASSPDGDAPRSSQDDLPDDFKVWWSRIGPDGGRQLADAGG